MTRAPEHNPVKLVIQGHERVGKSSIFRRYRDGAFDGGEYNATIGNELLLRTIKLQHGEVKFWELINSQGTESIPLLIIPRWRLVFGTLQDRRGSGSVPGITCGEHMGLSL